MPSPFPGMDPYLEQPNIWPAFQHQLVMCLYQIMLPGLVDRYRARISQRHYTADGASSDALHEDYLEIRMRGDGKLVTLLDVVSPANRTTGIGRSAYLETRRTAIEAGANVVEIDLVLAGQPMLAYSRDGLPDWDYAVTVTRATQPERHEIYTTTLQKRLPSLKLPLAADDRETVFNLQTAFTRCYDQGEFATRIDYGSAPPASVKLKDTARLWELLGLPSHEAIAIAAYHLWQKEGCPTGRDKEHWWQAIAELKRPRR